MNQYPAKVDKDIVDGWTFAHAGNAMMDLIATMGGHILGSMLRGAYGPQ